MSEYPLLYLLEIIRCVVLSVDPPLWDLSPAALALGEGVWVLLEDTDATPPVLAAKVQA